MEAPPPTWALTVGCTHSFVERQLYVSSARQRCMPGPALPPRPPQSVDIWWSLTVVPPSWRELQCASAPRGFGQTATHPLLSLSTLTRGIHLCRTAQTRFRPVAEPASVRPEAFLLYTTHTTYLVSRTKEASELHYVHRSLCHVNLDTTRICKPFYIKKQNVPTTLIKDYSASTYVNRDGTNHLKGTCNLEAISKWAELSTSCYKLIDKGSCKGKSRHRCLPFAFEWISWCCEP